MILLNSRTWYHYDATDSRYQPIRPVLLLHHHSASKLCPCQTDISETNTELNDSSIIFQCAHTKGKYEAILKAKASMTRDSHLQSKNWFRQLFEVAHHLSNSWPSYIRWHAFWLVYIFLKILNHTWSSPALQRCLIIRLPLPLTDWLPADHTHFSDTY